MCARVRKYVMCVCYVCVRVHGWVGSFYVVCVRVFVRVNRQREKDKEKGKQERARARESERERGRARERCAGVRVYCVRAHVYIYLFLSFSRPLAPSRLSSFSLPEYVFQSWFRYKAPCQETRKVAAHRQLPAPRQPRHSTSHTYINVQSCKWVVSHMNGRVS